MSKQSSASRRSLKTARPTKKNKKTPGTTERTTPRATGPLEEQDYYHGLLPREDIIQLLQRKGDYLVRHTEVERERKYVISCFWDKPRHFIITPTVNNKYKLGDEGDEYNSIPEMVSTFKSLGMPLSKASGAKLLQPVGRAKWELQHSQITRHEKLGEGAFGEVHRGSVTLEDGKVMPVAIKQSRLGGMSKADIAEMMKETRLMRQYDHPNVVKLYGVAAEQEPIMIVMELVTGGGLDKYVQKNNVSPFQLTKYCMDAAKGMAYLHSKQCIHRDVAARNCLITQDGVVKISDFGLSTKGSQYKMDAKKKVPIKWLSPEIMTSQIYTSKSDVWAYGIMVWEVFSEGSDPYPGMMAADVVRGVLQQGYRMAAPDRMPDGVRDVMYRCWRHEASDRPSMEEIVRLLQAASTGTGNQICDPTLIVAMMSR